MRDVAETTISFTFEHGTSIPGGSACLRQALFKRTWRKSGGGTSWTCHAGKPISGTPENQPWPVVINMPLSIMRMILLPHLIVQQYLMAPLLCSDFCLMMEAVMRIQLRTTAHPQKESVSGKPTLRPSSMVGLDISQIPLVSTFHWQEATSRNETTHSRVCSQTTFIGLLRPIPSILDNMHVLCTRQSIIQVEYMKHLTIHV